MTAPAFEWICERLEEQTDFSRLEARGTVRLALKAAGLDPKHVHPGEVAVVLRKRLAEQLASLRVPDAESLCERLASAVSEIPEEVTRQDSPEQIFARLGR